MLISDRIKEVCKEKGISVSKIEKDIGLGNGTIGKWGKNGRTPTHDRLVLVAKYLGVSVSYLTGETDEENPPPLSVDLGDGKTKINPALISEDRLDSELIKRLVSLSPQELERVDAFVQGLLAARKA